MGTRAVLVGGVLGCVCLVASASACSGRGEDPVAVAQVAVKANPGLELVATDERQGVLTVRVKQSGRIITVQASDVVAGTAFRDLDAAPAAQTTAPAPPATPAVAQAGTPPSAPGSPEVTSAPSANVSVTRTPGKTSVSTGAGRGSTGGVAVQSDPEGGVSVRTPAGTVSVGGRPGAPSSTTVTRAERSTPSTASPAPPAPQSAAPQAVPPRADATQDEPGAHIDESRLERRTRPVSCVGMNTVRLDGVLLQVGAVAIQALGTCDIRITNSRVVGQVAIEAAGNASFTIENSIIEGQVAIEAAGSSVLSVKSSTVRGPVQKTGGGSVRDLGKNLWR